MWAILKDSQAGVTFNYAIRDGRECGTVDASGATNDQGLSHVHFTPSPDIASRCEATIIATNPENKTVTAKVTVLGEAAEPVTIEATTAITIILIASFAIDRIVSGLMFLFGAKKVAAVASDASSADTLERQNKRQRLIYVSLAGLSGLALGYFGNVRILEGLGFSRDVPINVILTALILTAGSDAISVLLKKMGVGSIGEPEPKPLEVRGHLVLDRNARRAQSPSET